MFAWISTIVLGLVEWFAKWVSRPIACIAAYVAVMAVIISSLLLVVYSLITALNLPNTPSVISSWLNYLLPSNARLCISTLIAHKVAIMFFKYRRKTLEIAAIDCGSSGNNDRDYLT